MVSVNNLYHCYSMINLVINVAVDIKLLKSNLFVIIFHNEYNNKNLCK